MRRSSSERRRWLPGISGPVQKFSVRAPVPSGPENTPQTRRKGMYNLSMRTPRNHQRAYTCHQNILIRVQRIGAACICYLPMTLTSKVRGAGLLQLLCLGSCIKQFLLSTFGLTLGYLLYVSSHGPFGHWAIAITA